MTVACTLGRFSRVSIELLWQVISERIMSRGRIMILTCEGGVLNS